MDNQANNPEFIKWVNSLAQTEFDRGVSYVLKLLLDHSSALNERGDYVGVYGAKALIELYKTVRDNPLPEQKILELPPVPPRLPNENN